MSVCNWLGQAIEVGSVVGRGAREGDSSGFRVGRVERFLPGKRKARVLWLSECVYGRYVVDAGCRQHWVASRDGDGNAVGVPGAFDSFLRSAVVNGRFSSPVDVDSLFLLDAGSFGVVIEGLV